MHKIKNRTKKQGETHAHHCPRRPNTAEDHSVHPYPTRSYFSFSPMHARTHPPPPPPPPSQPCRPPPIQRLPKLLKSDPRLPKPLVGLSLVTAPSRAWPGSSGCRRWVPTAGTSPGAEQDCRSREVRVLAFNAITQIQMLVTLDCVQDSHGFSSCLLPELVWWQ
jgi:hypothetical protein